MTVVTASRHERELLNSVGLRVLSKLRCHSLTQTFTLEEFVHATAVIVDTLDAKTVRRMQLMVHDQSLFPAIRATFAWKCLAVWAWRNTRDEKSARSWAVAVIVTDWSDMIA